MCLPHDFSICQPFSAAWEAESAFLPGGVGWYRRSCHLPAGWAGKRVLLEFGGAYASAWVYVNGQYLGENHYGYGSFALDISGYVQFGGEKVIAVRVGNPIPTSRWYSGSGLYRRAWLTVTGPVYIDRYGITVTTPEKGRVAVAARLGNAGANPAEITLRHTILDGDTPLAQWESGFTLDGRRQVTASLHLPEPRLWSPDSPAMYTLATELTSAGEVLDRVETPFGFRWFRFTESGFYLNGEPAKLKGMCLHADQGALGAAAYPGAIARQLRLMEDMGANAVRTSHHAPEPALLDICARHGMLVVSDEIHQDIVFNGHVHNSCLKYTQHLDRIIVLTSASKTFNIAGLQNSFAVIPNEALRKPFDAYVKTLRIKKGVSLGYIAAEAGFTGGGPWLEETLQYLRENYNVLKETLTAALPEIRIDPLESTYMIWVDVSAYVAPEDVEVLVRDHAKLAVDFGFWFWPEGQMPEGDVHIRINVATTQENVRRAAQQLVAAIQDYRKK